MLNKRLLIKNLLSHNDENTFFDKKELIDLNSKEGKAKFLKHISALSNSNPENNSYLIIGIEDETNAIKGVHLLDDSKIQNLVKSYLIRPPLVKYENIYFPDLPKDKVVGLLTISPNKHQTTFGKSIAKIPKGTAYYRQGSNSLPIDDDFIAIASNKSLVDDLENYSKVSLKQLLDDLFDFFQLWRDAYSPQYLVFKEQFVVCWAGYPSDYKDEQYLSEVDIRILNEGSRFFYSAMQWVRLKMSDNDLCVTEYVILGFGDNYKLYKLEATILSFEENGRFTSQTKIIFDPPKFDNSQIKKLYIHAKELEQKIINGYKIQTTDDLSEYEGLANYFLICYLNGIQESKKDLINSKNYLDGSGAEVQSECLRILEKYEMKTATNTLQPPA